ncbi:hypothetical protein CLV52_2968 [Amnibacterium kyonggiense]|uniref:Uncharacterized protein n=1 Tax=Amnibacterium kyonggiense TaxID=595671 RepID=A0A4R7FEU5_9MICO|nr:hypothetical protein CLV52_2968 [Amnibacterium kyonggiense]
MSHLRGPLGTSIVAGTCSEGEHMRFEVPAATALVFSGADGELLSEPQTRPTLRIVEAQPEG